MKWVFMSTHQYL